MILRKFCIPSTILLLAECLLLVSLANCSPTSIGDASVTKPPTATLSSSNGKTKTVFVGRTLTEFDQDLFLGVKFADEPVRFTPAKLKTKYASNDSDSGAYDLTTTGTASSSKTIYYNATEYGYDCPGYGSDTTNLVNMSYVRLNENCLNLNVIRPKTGGDELLPVLIWIYGGGWQQGSTADPRFVQFSF